MVHRHSTVVEAYTTLGLQQGTSLEVVKTTYKQLALKTHPDKNPDNEDATAQFQKLSEAYNVLLKHLDSSPSENDHTHPRSHTHSHSHSHFHPFGGFGGYGGYYDDGYDDDFDSYEPEYEESDYDDDDEDDLDFYRFLFEEALRGYASRHAHQRYYHSRKTDRPAESPREYEARIKRQREEQEAAAARRARQAEMRKARQAEEREKEKRDAEARQQKKANERKAQFEASKKAAEDKAREQQERIQRLRSAVFASARRGDFEKVEKGVWEDNVDAAGGEIKNGSEIFVKSPPKDLSETLLHIAASKGNVKMVEWLDTHGAESEERNSKGFTAFHIALQRGDIPIIKYFFESYPPQDEDNEKLYEAPPSKSLLDLALDSTTPEAIWLILDNKLASKEDMEAAWKFVVSNAGRKTPPKGLTEKQGEDRVEEITNLLSTFGGFDRNKSSGEAGSSVDDSEQGDTVSESTDVTSPSEVPNTPNYQKANGKRRGRGSFNPTNPHQNQEKESNVPQGTSQTYPKGFPRGRGRGRGRGFRGRGRGGPPSS
ncbi:hypothetical protein ABKN59_004501 [Abortiporus biennis]